MILVTGAAGKTGRAIIQAVRNKHAQVRALVRRPEQIPEMENLGASDVVVGDMRDRNKVEEAVQGVEMVYHIPPNVSPDEISVGENIISAMRTEGVTRLVYHSVLHPQIKGMPHHWKKYQIEEKVLESGLSFTILQPTAYMQNLLGQLDSIIAQGVYSVPYPVKTPISLVDLKDVAEAAAIVLTEPGHEYAIYELVGTPTITQVEVAETLGKQLNRPVKANEISIRLWEEKARESGLGDYEIDTLVKMFQHYARYGLKGNSKVLTWLLERPPTTLAEFCSDAVKMG